MRIVMMGGASSGAGWGPIKNSENNPMHSSYGVEKALF
jgi:hypothetical protein